MHTIIAKQHNLHSIIYVDESMEKDKAGAGIVKDEVSFKGCQSSNQ